MGHQFSSNGAMDPAVAKALAKIRAGVESSKQHNQEIRNEAPRFYALQQAEKAKSAAKGAAQVVSWGAKATTLAGACKKASTKHHNLKIIGSAVALAGDAAGELSKHCGGSPEKKLSADLASLREKLVHETEGLKKATDEFHALLRQDLPDVEKTPEKATGSALMQGVRATNKAVAGGGSTVKEAGKGLGLLKDVHLRAAGDVTRSNYREDVFEWLDHVPKSDRCSLRARRLGITSSSIVVAVGGLEVAGAIYQLYSKSATQNEVDQLVAFADKHDEELDELLRVAGAVARGEAPQTTALESLERTCRALESTLNILGEIKKDLCELRRQATFNNGAIQVTNVTSGVFSITASALGITALCVAPVVAVPCCIAFAVFASTSAAASVGATVADMIIDGQQQQQLMDLREKLQASMQKLEEEEDEEGGWTIDNWVQGSRTVASFASSVVDLGEKITGKIIFKAGKLACDGAKTAAKALGIVGGGIGIAVGLIDVVNGVASLVQGCATAKAAGELVDVIEREERKLKEQLEKFYGPQEPQ